jgi:hypothetical protein
MINLIRGKNIKGNTFSQPLTGLDIFIGPNGIGKSTIQQALALAIVGYIPGKGKDESDTFQLSSSQIEMSAGLQMSNFTFDRSIKRTETLGADDKKTIKYSQGLTVSPSKGEKTATEMKSRILNEMGNFPMVFDFALFMDLSDAKRRDYMYSLSPITNESWTRDKVAERLNGLLTEALKATEPDLYVSIEELIKDALELWVPGYDLTSGLQNMINWLEGQQKEYNKKKSDATGAVRELNEMKNELEETDRGINAKKEELENLRKDHTDVHGQIEKGNEIKRQWDVKQERILTLKAEIQKIVDFLALPVDVDYEANIAVIKGKITQMDIASSTDEIQKKINIIRNNKLAKTTELDGIKQELSNKKAELHIAETVKKNISEKKIGACVLHPSIGCTQDFSKFTGHADKIVPELQETIATLSLDQTTIESEIKSLNEDESNLELERNTLNDSFAKEAKANKALHEEIEAIRKDEQAATQKRQAEINKQSSFQNELNNLVGEKEPNFTELYILIPQKEALKNHIDTAVIVLDEKEKAKITLSNKQTAIRSAAKSDYMFRGCKSIVAQLGAKGIQGELVKSILGPIEGSINENLQLMGIANPVYFSTESETGKEVFQFGWTKDGYKTNFNVLSEGEKMMFLSAFLVTLLERANPPVKVLAIDNIENLDEFNLPNVLNGLAALSHKVDNILVAGVIRGSELVGLEKWKVWDLTPKSKVAVNA